MKTFSLELAGGGEVRSSQWVDDKTGKRNLTLGVFVKFASIQLYPTPDELRAIAAKLIEAANWYDDPEEEGAPE